MMPARRSFSEVMGDLLGVKPMTEVEPIVLERLSAVALARRHGI